MTMNVEYQWGPAVVIPHKVSMLYGRYYVWFETKGGRGWSSILLAVAETDWELIK